MFIESTSVAFEGEVAATADGNFAVFKKVRGKATMKQGRERQTGYFNITPDDLVIPMKGRKIISA